MPRSVVFLNIPEGILFTELHCVQTRTLLLSGSVCDKIVHFPLTEGYFRPYGPPNWCPCPLSRGVCLREVKNVVLEKKNRRDNGLVSAKGRRPYVEEVRLYIRVRED